MTGFHRHQSRAGRLACLLLASTVLLLPRAQAQDTAKATLDTSDTVFAVLAAINHCGYNQELDDSEPVRAQIRADLANVVKSSPEADTASKQLCDFYRDHEQADPSRTLAQYLSLALNLSDPPQFALKLKEADMPPDASYVLGFVPLLQQFYKAASLQKIRDRHRIEYSALVDRYHGPISNMVLSTDVYLRMPISGYLGRHFSILLDPQAAPGQVNSRNYGADYFMVVSPERGSLKLPEIRHTYLHFVLDPLMAKSGAIKAMEPLLTTVQSAPMDPSFKADIRLLATESLIQAVEIRNPMSRKTSDADKTRAVDAAMAQGFVLTRFFYDSLTQFENGQVGLAESLPEWLFNADVGREKKLAQQVTFASSTQPEVMSANSNRGSVLQLAQQRMAEGDYDSAHKLAQQALDEKQGDVGEALFLLAQTSIMSNDASGAREYFQRALVASHDPRILAWSHIYLGRLADIQSDRAAAVGHYRAALQAGDTAPATKAAAERGLQQPYAPPSSSPQQEQ